MKIKTLLFGAGAGVANYIKNNITKCEFLAILDNDAEKHASVVHGVEVVSPSIISNYDFQQIVITTQWPLEVKLQLINELNVCEDKVIIPPKNQLKKITPFLHQDTLILGRTIIKLLSECALAEKVPFVVDFGTLLGLVRENDIIAWDDDIDFSLPESYASHGRAVIENFIAKIGHFYPSLKWAVVTCKDKYDKVQGYVIEFNDSTSHLIEFKTSICLRHFENGNAIHMPSLGMWYAPEKYFKQICVLNWQGCNIPTPPDVNNYLTFVYGDWNKPKKDIQIGDYANINNVTFAQIKAAGLVANRE